MYNRSNIVREYETLKSRMNAEKFREQEKERLAREAAQKRFEEEKV
jgi:hypothetical protein